MNNPICKFMEINNSNSIKKTAKNLIPHYTGTFSSSPTNFVEGVYPVYADHAKGCRFWDVDDNEFIDYLMGLGPITLGYNYGRINDAIINQIKNGILFSLPHKSEVELAELLCNIIPNADMVKLEKTGSNAVTGAVRAARALTKRDKIAYCGSGGVWHDWQAAMVSRNGGVPSFNNELIKIFDYNDNEGLEQIFDNNSNEISCIVLEPTIYEKPNKNFLKQVRKICDENDSILILDEIVTGFRFHLQGAQKFFDVKGDFVCFGKGIGNGLPISAITGPTEFMSIFNELWVSSTNNREMLSIAGTIATINEMKEKQTIDHCWKLGEILLNGWNKICMKYNIDAKLFGYPVRMTMKCFDTNNMESKSLKSLILQEMIKKGHFMSPGPIFLSYSHSVEDIDNTLNSFETVCQFISANVLNDEYEKFLEGEMPKTIWTMKIPSTRKSYR
jgi:glutamate-1-semialdehyde 2,1-aminomutase